MKLLRVEVPLYEDHPAFKAPRNASELIEAMSSFCLVKEFSWKIGDGPWERESVAHDYAAAVNEAYMNRKRWWEFWK